jgi:cytochrome oxidase Cu insertion factor (SCO1/SenC/PrrC family)
MSLSHRTLILLLAGCVLGVRPLAAQAPETTSPVVMGKAFSADVEVTGQDGTVINQKMYADDGKVRSELNVHGMSMTVIVRPDQQHVYSILEAQKMVMVMPYDPAKSNQEVAAATGLDGAYVKVGATVINGTPCTEYKLTSKQNKVYEVWVDDAQKIPVKMVAEDHSFSMFFRNYKVGPQDPLLFEPPSAGYQVMTMPSLPNPPSGGGGMPVP